MFTKEEIQKDFNSIKEDILFEKYYLSDYIWYFDRVLQIEHNKQAATIVEFKKIIAEVFKINEDDVYITGSAKIGLSLSPDVEKFLKPFSIDGNDRKNRKSSDLDVLIISNNIFERFWGLYRKSFKPNFSQTYNYIPSEVYRGYINERNVKEIDGCRKDWVDMTVNLIKNLTANFGIVNPITFRVYRSFFDFKDYCVDSLKKAKRRNL